MASPIPIICFDYGGSYIKDGADIKWISGEDQIHTLVMKKSVEEVTYSELVECICRKIKANGDGMVKISYFPLVLYSNKPSYIWSDEDVLGYLMQVNHDKCRSVLHVEISSDMDDTYGGLPLSGDGETDESYVGLSDGEDTDTEEDETDEDESEEDETEQDGDEQDGTNHDHEMDGMVTLYTAEQHENFELHENLEHGYEGTEVGMEVEAAREGVEATTVVEEEWDDGLDLVKGQEFRTKTAMQVLVQRGAHKNGFEYDTLKSDTGRFVARCRGAKEGCKWYLRVVKLKNSDLWTVRTYVKSHTCSVVTTSTLRNGRRGTPQVVASVLGEEYPGRYDTPRSSDLISMVTRKVGVKVSYATAWRGKRLAANEVRGTPEESFSMIHSYMHMLKLKNPDSVSYVEVDAAKRFKYLFFAFGASIEGFVAMRKVIIVDGTHLKHVYGGVLLVATAQDPDRHHYPIAFGVVDGEKDESWTWFMNKLRSVISDVDGLVFLSDRNASLIKSIREVFPTAAHGYCVWHLSQNVKGHVFNNRDVCAIKFRECAYAYTVAEFDVLYDAFSRKYPSAAEYLEKSVEVGKWARCYFEGDRYNVDTTNAAESINGVLREARKYFMLPMIDVIIKKMAEWFNPLQNFFISLSQTTIHHIFQRNRHQIDLNL
ncbi:protein FAR1-RELATED SEQUENCE 5-like [Raphanus sativus]|uniref:Protein FAR1-RELATED SEQUENCE 5-like n=1 Tax=Raphanus sativus TaxID=3726 RepID=A0A9W3CAT1_RAPSA|nr:protein FAR1-RELATED SEQUENCE 5-like [Raphanus sativus]XP_056848649.1 protein FAR1-RELATED SEQUENCE 5-like [Raphanus sativus]